MPGIIDPHNPRACPADACLELDRVVSDLLSHTPAVFLCFVLAVALKPITGVNHNQAH